jgi:hypothetical protein
MRSPNYYTCSTLFCIDRWIYKLKGKDTFWTKDGALVEQHKSGSLSEVRTHFPDWMFLVACRIQNKWPWTRNLLSI